MEATQTAGGEKNREQASRSGVVPVLIWWVLLLVSIVLLLIGGSGYLVALWFFLGLLVPGMVDLHTVLIVVGYVMLGLTSLLMLLPVFLFPRCRGKRRILLLLTLSIALPNALIIPASALCIANRNMDADTSHHHSSSWDDLEDWFD